MTFCQEHLVSVPEGTKSPLHCCAACAAECEIVELPFPPLRCFACEQAIGLRHSLTGNGAETWHTRCWNAAEERRKIAAAEFNKIEQLEMPTPKPMSAALEHKVSEVA
jgi:hypothetical protein